MSQPDTEPKMVVISLEKEAVDILDTFIEKHGGDYKDWITISVIHRFLSLGRYSTALKIFLEVEFTVSEVEQYAINMLFTSLEELEEKP